ncbi:hypothetical protein D6D13_07585 [Aureobasidium pullulans]|uniref:Uncharacterized protein n=1 Tax=Aureobasidium pullulans TaxID=5580 RepID=A0A4S9CBS0_AURPU|nr:hypothetical protein D6D13_07585 [Aureobasidium pullulans]
MALCRIFPYMFLVISVLPTVLSQENHHTSQVQVHRRQYAIEEEGETVLDCFPSCEFTSCGSGSNTCGLNRRNPINNISWFEENATNTSTASLLKREWKIGSEDGTHLETKAFPWTIDEVNAYVYNQVVNNWDTQYGQLRGFFINGTPWLPDGYCGFEACRVDGKVLDPRTLLGTTSDRLRTRQAHFWESYTNGKPNAVGTDDSDSITAFDERMIFFLRNQPVDRSTANKGVFTEAYPKSKPTKNHPYLVPSGDPLENGNFNQPDDDTQVFIMTPADDVENPTKKNPKLKYTKRVARVQRALRSYLGRGAKIVIVPYFRKNTDLEPYNTDQRGMALFQYDPDADGKGSKQWRLFYENRVFQGDVAYKS